MKIVLNNINNTEYRILSGVELGEIARKQFDFDRLDNLEETIEIMIPDEVLSVNSSFFSGAFQKSIKILKIDKFRERYHFICDDIIRQNIENGIFNIEKTLDLLGGQS